MYRTILVPLDGSPAAEHALPWALSVAQQNNCALELVRVHRPPMPAMIGSEIGADILVDDAVRRLECEYLERMAYSLRQQSMAQVNVAVIQGRPANAIRECAKSTQADLIVMTTHGRGALARFWLGSVADQVVRMAGVPTLLVRPPDEQAADLNDRPFVHRLVVALDGSAHSERILDPAMQFGRTAGSDFFLVMVLEAPDAIATLEEGQWPSLQLVASRAKALGYLEQVAERLRAERFKVQTEVLEHTSPALAVLDFADTHGNAVIALATRGHGGLMRMTLGSTADKIIRGGTMPVLVYHPDAG
jgi:nucleotide-binding universal stress UspA family protein